MSSTFLLFITFLHKGNRVVFSLVTLGVCTMFIQQVRPIEPIGLGGFRVLVSLNSCKTCVHERYIHLTSFLISLNSVLNDVDRRLYFV